MRLLITLLASSTVLGCSDAAPPGAGSVTSGAAASSAPIATVSSTTVSSATAEAPPLSPSEVAFYDECDRLDEHWLKVANPGRTLTEQDKKDLRELMKFSSRGSMARFCRESKFTRAELDCMFKAQRPEGFATCLMPRLKAR